jgi:dTDP-4-dehydrorhamnose reductase
VKILIVGASGFVGRHVLRLALAAGHDAVGTQSHHRGGQLIPLDLTHDRLADCLPLSWFADESAFVVLSAAIPSPDRCRLERNVAYQTNVTGAIRLMSDAVTLGAVPIFLSSSFVFDGYRGGYADQEPRSPISEYGRQKAEVELFVERELPRGLVLRLDKTIGDDPREHHLLTEWWTQATTGRPIRCIEGQDFSVTLVDDVARGILLACERGLRGTYNLASPEHDTRERLAHRFLDAARLVVPVTSVSQSQLGFADPRSLKSWLESGAFMRATGLTFTPSRDIFASFLQRTSV